MSGSFDKIGTVGVQLSGLLAAGLMAVSCSPSTVPTGPGLSGSRVATGVATGVDEGGGGSGSSGLESAVVAEINRYRASRGRAPLARHGGLDGLAQGHAVAMRERGRISHDGFGQRSGVGESRYGMTWMAENVLYGRGAAESGLARKIVESWISSSGHRKNLLRPNEYVGVGVARGSDGSYWATQLSARKGSEFDSELAQSARFGPPGMVPNAFPDFGF